MTRDEETAEELNALNAAAEAHAISLEHARAHSGDARPSPARSSSSDSAGSTRTGGALGAAAASPSAADAHDLTSAKKAKTDKDAQRSASAAAAVALASSRFSIPRGVSRESTAAAPSHDPDLDDLDWIPYISRYPIPAPMGRAPKKPFIPKDIDSWSPHPSKQQPKPATPSPSPATAGLEASTASAGATAASRAATSSLPSPVPQPPGPQLSTLEYGVDELTALLGDALDPLREELNSHMKKSGIVSAVSVYETLRELTVTQSAALSPCTSTSSWPQRALGQRRPSCRVAIGVP